MALDSRRKRMAATNIGCPWRGPMIHPTVTGFDFFDRGVVLGTFARIVILSISRQVIANVNRRLSILANSSARISIIKSQS